MNFNNNIPPDQLEVLAILSEELGEVQQIIGKILRHGFDSHAPNNNITNRTLLERELGDLEFAVDLLSISEVDPDHIEENRLNKRSRILAYLQYQRNINYARQII